jgi:hypothetical protein
MLYLVGGIRVVKTVLVLDCLHVHPLGLSQGRVAAATTAAAASAAQMLWEQTGGGFAALCGILHARCHCCFGHHLQALLLVTLPLFCGSNNSIQGV